MSVLTREVSLKNARFFAFHGFYPEEQVTGGEFMVSISVFSVISNYGDDNLDRTVNYEELYGITAARMSVPAKLLETVAGFILDDIKEISPGASSISVSIAKSGPPMPGQIGAATVTLTFTA